MELLTRFAVWIAIASYGGASSALLLSPARWRLARAVWVLGAAAFSAHAALAFHAFYGWSHATALRETARQAEALSGVAAGWGLYLNYAFGIVWIADAAAFCRAGERYLRRPRGVAALLHGFFIFMIANGAIIFAAGPVRWFAAAVLGAVAASWWWCRRAKRCKVGRGKADPLES